MEFKYNENTALELLNEALVRDKKPQEEHNAIVEFSGSEATYYAFYNLEDYAQAVCYCLNIENMTGRRFLFLNAGIYNPTFQTITRVYLGLNDD